MDLMNSVKAVAAPSNEEQPNTPAGSKPELAVLSDMELLLCGGGEGIVCW